MAKIPTLNVDVKVNTKTMQKDVAEANKKLQQIGGKGAALAGGGIGKLGSLGSLGGGLGSAAIGAAGITAAAMAPFKLGSFVVDAFSEAAKRATDSLEKLEAGRISSTYADIGVVEPFARRLAAGADEMAGAEAAGKGIMDTFWAAMSDEQGRLGGVGGFVAEEYGKGGMETLKESMAWLGAILGGKSFEEAGVEATMSTSPNPAAYASDLAQAQANRGQGANPFWDATIFGTTKNSVQMFMDLFS